MQDRKRKREQLMEASAGEDPDQASAGEDPESKTTLLERVLRRLLKKAKAFETRKLARKIKTAREMSDAGSFEPKAKTRKELTKLEADFEVVKKLSLTDLMVATISSHPSLSPLAAAAGDEASAPPNPLLQHPVAHRICRDKVVSEGVDQFFAKKAVKRGEQGKAHEMGGGNPSESLVSTKQRTAHKRAKRSAQFQIVDSDYESDGSSEGLPVEEASFHADLGKHDGATKKDEPQKRTKRREEEPEKVKNRMGQRARRAIWQQMHREKTISKPLPTPARKKDHSVPHESKDMAIARKTRRDNQPNPGLTNTRAGGQPDTRVGVRKAVTTKVVASGSKPSSSSAAVVENLHPSWVAKRMQKEAENARKNMGTGKKVVFDDD